MLASIVEPTVKYRLLAQDSNHPLHSRTLNPSLKDTQSFIKDMLKMLTKSGKLWRTQGICV